MYPLGGGEVWRVASVVTGLPVWQCVAGGNWSPGYVKPAGPPARADPASAGHPQWQIASAISIHSTDWAGHLLLNPSRILESKQQSHPGQIIYFQGEQCNEICLLGVSNVRRGVGGVSLVR